MLGIVIDPEKCDLCALCVEACPTECIELSENGGQEIVVNESECILCENCEEQCPLDAITVEVKETPQ